MTPMPTKADRSRALRYKKAALQSMSYNDIVTELSDIMVECDDVAYYMDEDSLVEALDGNDEDAWEFQMLFTDLSGKATQLDFALHQMNVEEYYDDCTVALIGNRYNIMGFDAVEEDYFGLCSYDSDLAKTASGKRLLRLTKEDMMATIGQCVGILLAFLDLRYQYDYMKATFDILKDKNHSILQQVKEIEQAYENEEWNRIDQIVRDMPDRLWVE